MKTDRFLSGMFFFFGVVGLVPLILSMALMTEDFTFWTAIFFLLCAGLEIACFPAHEHYHASVVLQQSREREEQEERERREWWERHEKANKEWLEQQAQQSARAAGVSTHSDMRIIGPPQFVKTVHSVLDELLTKLPHRYQEVIRYLPKAEFKPDLRSNRHPGRKVAGRSDGCFSIDGSGHRYHGDGRYTKKRLQSFSSCLPA